MRLLRNRVAHAFGLDHSGHPYAYISASTRVTVTEDRLQKWLATVDAVVSAIDQDLTDRYVGDFETLELLHYWQSDRDQLLRSTHVALDAPALNAARPFLKYLSRLVGRTNGGKEYWKGFHDFYKTA